MKIIHQGGYSSSELTMYRLTVFKNLIDCAKALIAASKQFDIELENKANEENCKYILEYNLDPDPHGALEPRVAEAIYSLWKDPCIPKIMDHSSEFYLMDSAP